MNKKETDDLTNDMLIADALLRLKTLENLLIAKGIITKDEFLQEMEAIAKQIAKSVLEKAGVPGVIDDLLKTFQIGSKPSNN